MQTLTFECDIEADRPLVLHLPGSVTAGRHRVALVIDPPEFFDCEAPILPVPADVPPRTALWARLEALRAQAQQEGTLPPALTCDEILAEVRREGCWMIRSGVSWPLTLRIEVLAKPESGANPC